MPGILLYLQQLTKMKTLLTLTTVFITMACFSQALPSTRRSSTTLKKHSWSYKDDYVWLENMRAPETEAWVEEQNKFTDNFISTLKTKAIASKIAEYRAFSSNALPQRKGRYFYSRYRYDMDKPGVLCYRKKLSDPDVTILVDPYKIYNDTKTTIAAYFPSDNSRLLCYAIKTDGSDRNEIRFRNIDSNTDCPDILKSIRLTNIEWKNDEGIFYKRNANNDFFGRDSTFQLYYHAMGDLQEKDKLIYDTTASQAALDFSVSDGKLFIIETDKGTGARTYKYALLKDPAFSFKTILENDKSGNRVMGCRKGRLYFSSKAYNWGEVRSCPLDNFTDQSVIIPQVYTHLLISTRFLEDYIICQYRTASKYYLAVYDSEAKFIRKFDAPQGTIFDVKFLDKETGELFVTMQSFTIAPQNFRLNLKTGESDPYYNEYLRPISTLFPLDHFETKRISYKSRDGQDIPMTIIFKKGMVLSGDNPLLLYGYGGFGVVRHPSYDVGLLYFLQKGGIYAIAEVRGGGEKGPQWHKEGSGMNKQNSINDFVDAAQYLITEKYTNPARLAITGASHGGLLVAGAMLQRPELFKLVLCDVGRLDLSRLEDFTYGVHHYDEYGNPEKANEFNYMMQYSPYHNIREDVNYPACFISTSENDDRVPPFNSYKFAARLQNRTAQANPVYLQVRRQSGHQYRSTTFNQAIEEEGQFYAVLMEFIGRK
jgi:prolyl oligopeptidase